MGCTSGKSAFFPFTPFCHNMCPILQSREQTSLAEAQYLSPDSNSNLIHPPHLHLKPRFELFEGSQLHIDMDDEWQGISHYRVTFKPFEKMIADSSDVVKNWPKPLTIEYLEEEYLKWTQDLMSVCWEGKEVRELGANGKGNEVGI